MDQVLPGTEPLEPLDDFAAAMVAGIDRYLLRELAESVARRAEHWRRDFSSPAAYAASVAPNRERLRRRIGAVDPRLAPAMERVAAADSEGEPGLVAVWPGYRVLAVRWPVLPGLDGEGLLVLPDGEPVADVVVLPDCEQSPEQWLGLEPGAPAPVARRLAGSGCRVLVAGLIDRRTDLTREVCPNRAQPPHRELIYRAAFEMGRHPIGFEVEQVCAAVDWLAATATRPVGIHGYGEGGLVALFAGAVDERLEAVGVSGHFQPRETVWREPIDRNVWGLLEEFGDAELASLIAPRRLVIEDCPGPKLHFRDPSDTDQGPTPGELVNPSAEAVAGEVARARALTAGLPDDWLSLHESPAPGGEAALGALLNALGGRLSPPGEAPRAAGRHDPAGRRRRRFRQMLDYTQQLLDRGEARRKEYWSQADESSAEAFAASCVEYRRRFWEEVIGPLAPASLPPRPRTRLRAAPDGCPVYDVVLDVHPDVVAYGMLMLPEDLQPGERRPVVVCQHGLEGQPERAVLSDDSRAYNVWGAKLVREGFIVFAPQNPYRGFDSFRTLQRKGNLLRRSLFSFIVRQHEVILDWLAAQPFVDPDRIGFYGISYGGKTAMRVPAMLDRYALSICSGDYNEWVRKCAQVDYPNGYMFTNEYEMFEFDLGNTFNYAEMSWLIFPRPFMVERGHQDGCGTDSWVAYEFAKAFRRYSLSGLADRAVIEWFDGPHTIWGQGTFEFLRRWLGSGQ